MFFFEGSDPKDRYIPVHMAAKHFGVLTQTLLTDLKLGRVPVLQVGGQWQVNEAEFKEWLRDKHAKAKEAQFGGEK